MNVLKRIVKAIYNKANGYIKKGQWYNEVKFPNCKKFWDYNTFNTDIVNLGSTSGLYAFNYEGLPIKGSNWALSQNPLSGDLAILKNYESYLNPKKSTCIISLCVFSSLSGSYIPQEDRYYTLLYPSSIPHFSYRKQQEVKSIRNNPLLHYPLISLFSDLKYAIRSKKTTIMTDSELVKDAKKWISGWLKEFSLSDLSAPLSLINKDGLEDAARILNEMITFCKERNIIPIIVLPPMYYTLNEEFSYEARHTLIDSLIEKVEDKSVPFYNYMDDEMFNNDRTLFRNSFFLNERGAKLFTKRLLSDLKYKEQ